MSTHVKMNFGAAREASKLGSMRSAKKAIEHWLERSNETVPFLEGTLKRSGHTEVEATTYGALAVISYNTPYARRQHEELNYVHKGKGRAKWVERTAQEQLGAISAICQGQYQEQFP